MSQMKFGAFLSYLSIMVTLMVALLYTPIMIRMLGQSEYGLYALIGSVAAYFSVLDMGLGNAIVRYTAKNRAVDDKLLESKLNGMFLTLYSLIGFVTFFIGLIVLNKIEFIFGSSLTPEEIDKAKIMVKILICNFALSFPLSVFGSIMQAYERFIVLKLLGMIRTILIPLITLPILFWGFGSIAMVLITSIVNITLLLFNVFYSFKYLKTKFYFGKFDFKLLKEIMGYSFFIFLNVLVDLIYWNTDQSIIGAITGTEAVAIFAIAMQFIVIFKMFSTSISGLFLPKATIMITKNATLQTLTSTMIKFGRIQYMIMAFIFVGFVLFGSNFIEIWVGKEYKDVYLIVIIIMIPLIIPLIQNFGISVLQAKNLHGFRSVLYLIIAGIKIIISIPLVINFGGVGSAIATAISLTLGHVIVINIYYHKRIGLNMLLFWKNILRISKPMIASLILGYFLNYFWPQNNILLLISKILIFSLIFISLLWKFGFNKYEKELFLAVKNKVILTSENIVKKMQFKLNK